MNKAVLVFVIVIFFVVIVYYRMSSPNFYSHDDTFKFLYYDIDGYVERMTPQDFISQGCATRNQFITKISSAADDFTFPERMKCLIATKNADKFLRNLKIEGIDAKKLANLDWNLALTRGRAYEEGLPHTRRDVIFISDDVLSLPMKDLTRTLIHEKVHVYERLNPQDIYNWMSTVGFKRYKRQSDYKNARSNPDVDGWVYLDPNGRETVVLYRSENPAHLDDVHYPYKHDSSSEHPYETLAYMVDYLYGKATDEMSELGYNNDYVNQFLK